MKWLNKFKVNDIDFSSYEKSNQIKMYKIIVKIFLLKFPTVNETSNVFTFLASSLVLSLNEASRLHKHWKDVSQKHNTPGHL